MHTNVPMRQSLRRNSWSQLHAQKSAIPQPPSTTITTSATIALLLLLALLTSTTGAPGLKKSGRFWPLSEWSRLFLSRCLDLDHARTRTRTRLLKGQRTTKAGSKVVSSQTVAMMQIDEELAREELKHNVLVYDKGGGTFDGSLFTSYGRSQITGVSDFVPTEWSQRLFRGRPTSSRKTSKSRSPRRRKPGGDGNGDDPPEQGDRSPGERPCPKPCGYQRPGCTQSCFCGPSGHRPWRPEVPHTCGACTLPSASETEEDPNETVPGEGTLLPCQFGSSRGPEWPQPSVSRATGGRQLAQSTLEAETSPDQDTLSETGEETTDVTTPTSVATQKGPQSRDRLPGWSFEEVEVVDGNADSGTDAEAAGRLAAEGQRALRLSRHCTWIGLIRWSVSVLWTFVRWVVLRQMWILEYRARRPSLI